MGCIFDSVVDGVADDFAHFKPLAKCAKRLATRMPTRRVIVARTITILTAASLLAWVPVALAHSLAESTDGLAKASANA